MQHPTWRIVVGALAEVDPSALGQIPGILQDQAGLGASVAPTSLTPTPTVMVNGLATPIVRVAFSKLGAYFERIYTDANQAFFQNQLPACKIAWNRRFRNLGGRIDCRRRLLELSAAHFEACGAVALGVVLIHEQIHLSLFEQGLPSGHTPLFKARSCAIGLTDIHHAMPLPARLKKPAILHLYQCRCGKVIESPRRFRTPRACTACCNQFNSGRYDVRFALRLIGRKILQT